MYQCCYKHVWVSMLGPSNTIMWIPVWVLQPSFVVMVWYVWHLMHTYHVHMKLYRVTVHRLLWKISLLPMLMFFLLRYGYIVKYLKAEDIHHCFLMSPRCIIKKYVYYIHIYILGKKYNNFWVTKKYANFSLWTPNSRGIWQH